MIEHAWGFPVALDLFFAGLAAGSFCFSVLAARYRGAGFDAFARFGAYLAPISLGLGMMMLVVDLMNKPRFWFTLTVFNGQSPMSLGVWLLSVFGIIAVLYAFCWLPESLRERLPILGTLAGEGNGYRKFLGILGLPFALAVSVYTGVLLSAASYPLWRNPILPVVFCFSAMVTGFAGATIVARWFAPAGATKSAADWLASAYRVLLPLYLMCVVVFLVFSFFAGRHEAAFVLLTGAYGVVWWCGVFGFGIILPLIFVARKKSMNAARLSVVLYSLLAGGLLLRLILVFAGQVESGNLISGVL
jgi:polysulfide reductase chain C